MSLVFASIIPNSPLLVQEIGKDDYKKLSTTNESLDKIKANLEKIQPDTVIILACNKNKINASFSIYQNPIYNYNFEKYGNFNLKSEIKGNIGLTHKIREALETKIAIQMLDSANLEHNFSVPIHLLLKDLPNIDIIPINCADLNLKEHIKLGKILKHEILLRKRKIAIIASGCIENKKESLPTTNDSKNFSKKLINYLTEKTNNDKILERYEEADVEGLLILKGILDKINCKTTIHSCEKLNKEHFLVAEFNF